MAPDEEMPGLVQRSRFGMMSTGKTLGFERYDIHPRTPGIRTGQQPKEE